MQVKTEQLEPTKIKLIITADQPELEVVRQRVVEAFGKSVKLQGFRQGKAPKHLVEKAIDQNQLQTEFLEQAVNDVYLGAVDQEKIRPVAQPSIAITKFVPFTTLEFTAETEAVGTLTLPDYAKLKVARPVVAVTTKQVDEVIKNLQARAATKKEVKRAAKNGDEVILDFYGTDVKTHDPISGADGKDYPLVLGSNSFIPGFEDALIGLKAGDTKDIPLTFPKEYGVKDLQNRQVNFAVTIHKVQSLANPKLDATFAASIGPFKTVDELKADIRRELEQQQTQEGERQYENQLLEAIAADTKVAIPPVLVDEEVERLEQQERQNTAYRGQTWQEHLDQEGLTADEHKTKNRPAAELRVKAGLVLGEIADKEKIMVTPEEIDVRISLLKAQYEDDSSMQAELKKPENRRDVINRLLTEKTLDHLKSLIAA